MDDLIREVDECLVAMESERQVDFVSTLVETQISTDELEMALKTIRHAPDEKRIRNIVKRLDTDGDGRVFINEILKIAEEMDDSEGRGVVLDNKRNL